MPVYSVSPLPPPDRSDIVTILNPIAVAYRLAPETRFPGSLHDAVSTYFRMLDDLHIPPSNILFAGDSAGGGLCLALLMYLRDNDYPLPAGAILLSPWVGAFTFFVVVRACVC